MAGDYGHMMPTHLDGSPWPTGQDQGSSYAGGRSGTALKERE